MARTILITGGAGFIGSHTADALLSAGHTVRILDCLDPQVHGVGRLRPAYLANAVEMRLGDVRDPDAMRDALRGVDTVFHFAAMTSTSQSMYQMQRYMDVNVSGTAALWDAVAAGGGVERVVLASSRAVYGEGAHICDTCGRVAPDGRPATQLDNGDWAVRCPACGASVRSVATDEMQPPKPQSIYATTKLFQEELSRQAGCTLGVKTIVLRYFNVYGPRQALGNPYTGIANVFFSRRLDGLPIQLFEDGGPVRDFVSIRDVVRANLLALEAPAAAAAINIGSGVPTTIRAMGEAICRVLDLPLDIAVTGWSRVGDIRSCFADIGLAGTVLGYRPAVSLQEGLAELMTWVRAVGRPGERYRAMLDEIRAKGILRDSAGAAP